MSLGKLTLFLFLISQTASANPAKTFEWYDAGMNYTMWNEPLSISQDGVKSDGFNNNAGIGLLIEKNSMKNRWFESRHLTLAIGRSTAGGLNPFISFPEGFNHPWYLAQTSYSELYRIDPTFMMGAGVVLRLRFAEWKTSDPTVTVEAPPNFSLNGQIQLRWRVTDKLTFTQNFIPLDTKGSTVWNWSAQTAF